MPGVEEIASAATTTLSIACGFIIVSSFRVDIFRLIPVYPGLSTEDEAEIGGKGFLSSHCRFVACCVSPLSSVCCQKEGDLLDLRDGSNRRMLLMAGVRIPRLQHPPCH